MIIYITDIITPYIITLYSSSLKLQNGILILISNRINVHLGFIITLYLLNIKTKLY